MTIYEWFCWDCGVISHCAEFENEMTPECFMLGICRECKSQLGEWLDVTKDFPY